MIAFKNICLDFKEQIKLKERAEMAPGDLNSSTGDEGLSLLNTWDEIKFKTV
jgi:hypothetical protein